MNVGDLQQHLTALGRLFEASGAKQGTVAELTAICAGLAPFRELPLQAFADFLVRAEAYSRGEVPVIPDKRRRSGTKGATGGGVKPPPADTQALVQEVRTLYDRAADPSTTEASIDAAMGRLAPLSKDGLVAVAEAIELKGMKSKSKAEIVKAIRQRILARKGATQRAGLINPPAPASSSPVVPVNPG